VAVSNTDSSEELREVVARLEREVADLRASRRRLAEAAVSERRAMERELHDGVQQNLVARAVDLQRLAGLIDGDRSAAQAEVAEMRTNARAALDEAARLATRIYPPIADGRGLVAALRSAASEAGVAAVVEVPGSADYAPEVTAALYWTWLDAINGAPPGSDAAIRMLPAAEGLAFEVTVGWRVPDGRVETLRDRIEALDGRLDIDDRHDGGTRLQASLPLPR
jgi:signal transduction histidine kinase